MSQPCLKYNTVQILPLESALRKINKELIQALQRGCRDFSIHRVKKITKCNLHAVIMNQAIHDSCKKSEETEKGCVEIMSSIPFVSYASYYDQDKDKSKFIEVTCRYILGIADSKINNYHAHMKTFDPGTPDDAVVQQATRNYQEKVL